MIPDGLLLITSFFNEVVSIACSPKVSQNFFMKILTLYTFRLISMILNDDLVNIEKPDAICSPTFGLHEIFKTIFTPISLFLLNIQDLHK